MSIVNLKKEEDIVLYLIFPAVLVDGVHHADNVVGRVVHVGDRRVGVKAHGVELVAVLKLQNRHYVKVKYCKT